MIVDCFPFFNELDILEIRLNSLAPYVDRFVLTECNVTHSGNQKPLFFAENKERFKIRNKKIVFIVQFLFIANGYMAVIWVWHMPIFGA